MKSSDALELLLLKIILIIFGPNEIESSVSWEFKGEDDRQKKEK
jgi:hypothetical protein